MIYTCSNNNFLSSSYSASFDDFIILKNENRKFFQEVKENLLIIRNLPSLNRNIITRGGSRINFRVLPKFYKKMNIEMM